MEQIQRAEKEWEEGPVKEFLARVPDRKPRFTTASGIPVKRIYTPLDIKDLDYIRDLALPGVYPFIRGAYPTMYRAQLWTFRPETGRPTPEETNAQFKEILRQGATGLSLGYNYEFISAVTKDPDDPAFQERHGPWLGWSGIAYSTLRDWEIMFDGIPLDKYSVSLNEHFATARTLAFLIATAKKQGVSPEKLTGNCENDPYENFYCCLIPTWPPKPCLRLAVDLFEFCTEHMPRWNLTSISAYNRGEAGANAIQELALSFADAVAYIEAAISRGIDIDKLAPRFPWYISVQRDFFENVAKLRAARRIWAKLLKERFGAKKPESWRMKMHVQTAGRTAVAQQPEVNLLRGAIQGLSAVLGGVQSLHITTFDEPLGTPTDYAQRLSLRTHQVIACESGVTNTIDPLAGSYFVETLTNQMEEEVWKLLNKIEDIGGALAAIKQGFYFREIEKNILKEHKALKDKETIVVGQNEFTSAEEQPEYHFQEPDPKGMERLVERVRQVKRDRDNNKVREILGEIKEAAAGERNLMPLLIEAVEAYATVAEIGDVLTEVWGLYPHSVESKPISSA